MNYQALRELCLSFEGTYDYQPFNANDPKYRTVTVFYVGPKWFCMADDENFESINLKHDPELIPNLIDTYSGIRPAYHMNKKHWISVFMDDDVPDELIAKLVRRSYELVFAKLTKKEKAELDFMKDFKKDELPQDEP